MTTPPRPVPNSTLPFWRAGDLHEIDSHRTADFPTEADVLIIGAGYAGVSLAYHILQKDARRRLRVVVLEAREVCSGATGRNGRYSILFWRGSTLRWCVCFVLCRWLVS